MSRIAILGNAAGGKSTLARHLSDARGLPHIEIDALYWRSDWSQVPAEDYNRAHDAAVAQQAWIMDGGGDMASIRRRLARTTEVILLDLPLWVHYWRAAERQIAWASGTLEHPPGGGQSVPPTGRLFELIWLLDRDWMPELRRLCDAQEAKGKMVQRVTSTDAFEALFDKA